MYSNFNFQFLEISSVFLGHHKRLPRGYQEATERLPRGYREATKRLPRGYREATERLPRGYREAIVKAGVRNMYIYEYYY